MGILNNNLLSYELEKVEGLDIEVTPSGRISIPSGVLSRFAEEAFKNLSFYMRASHLEELSAVINDPSSSDNERFVCCALLKNAVIAADEVYPICQDTGTATVAAWKGDGITTCEDDEFAISQGIEDTYKKYHLRYSQVAPLSMFEEMNTGSNMPAQIDIFAAKGNEYRFLFVAKGAGSSNKTSFFQQNRALLSPENLFEFLQDQIPELGADACPPYNIAVVIGGTSPERNLKVQKLATTGWLDCLPTCGDASGRAFRDVEWEDKVMVIAENSGIGAQFGGRHLALRCRVVRLPRHGGSCPVSIGVSCSAHRNIAGKISKEGVFLEKLDKNPMRFLSQIKQTSDIHNAPKIDLDLPIEAIIEQLTGASPGDMFFLNGTLIVARDLAHARISDSLNSGGEMPEYMKEHPVCYAGPAKSPPGRPIGSFGPTTSKRMDAYIDKFMRHGASLISVGKGGRSELVSEACCKYGGFYLGTLGGAAALIAKEHITDCELVDFPEFGMEAVYKIKVDELPVFVLCDDKGRMFYR